MTASLRDTATKARFLPLVFINPIPQAFSERLTGQRPERCYVDLGYRGHDVTDVDVFKARQQRGVTRSIRRELKRRNAIEPIIGHMKTDGLLHRNHLKGTDGDAINVILCGAGQNLRLILNYLRIFWLNVQQPFTRNALFTSPCSS